MPLESSILVESIINAVLETLPKTHSREDCIDTAAAAFDQLSFFGVRESRLHVCGIPSSSGTPGEFDHVWIELDDKPIDPFQDQYRNLVDTARKNNQVLLDFPPLVAQIQGLRTLNN